MKIVVMVVVAGSIEIGNPWMIDETKIKRERKSERRVVVMEIGMGV